MRGAHYGHTTCTNCVISCRSNLEKQPNTALTASPVGRVAAVEQGFRCGNDRCRDSPEPTHHAAFIPANKC